MIPRRNFMYLSGLGLLSASQILQAQEAAGTQHKAVINVFLAGGPPHQDMWDIKDKAPKEIRGEFDPISTSIAGVQIGECFPKIAAMFDKFTAIRSVVGCVNSHDSYQCVSGWSRKDKVSGTNYPAIGCVSSKVLGSTNVSVPACAGLTSGTGHKPWSEAGSPGYLGDAHKPFKPNGEMMDDLKLNIENARLDDRKKLLRLVGKNSPEINTKLFTEESFSVLNSSRLVDALDVTKEDPKVRARYGTGKPFKYTYDGAPTDNEQLLIARRLIEAGLRSVTLSYGRWDSHGANFDLVRDHGSKLDQCVSALVEDLDERGMLDDVMVVVWGEFGRTPKINKGAGRDHWPQVSCALLAGGGFKHGQTIGETNKLGEIAIERPIHMQEICGMMYRGLGIEPDTTTIIDNTGRPQYLLEHRTPIKELV